MKSAITVALGLFLASAVPVCSLAGSPQPQKLTHWQYVSLPVRTPFLNDSISPEGKKYDNTQLLKSRLTSQLKNAKAVSATDTAGFVSLAEPKATASNGSLHVLQTSIRSPRFVKGKIRATSQLPFAIVLDGKELSSKTSRQDSLTSASTIEAPVTLEPERDALLSLRVLCMSDDSLAPSARVEFVPEAEFTDITVYSAPDLKKRLKLADTQYYNSISGARLSPDDKYLLLSESLYYDAKSWRSTSRLVDVRTGRVLNPSVAYGARWMPNADILYYTVKNGEAYDLYNLDPASGREHLVAQSIPTNDFNWAPDGKTFFYAKTDEGVKESGPLRRYATPDDRMPGDRTRYFVMHYDPATGLSEQLTYGNHTTQLCDISPDGSNILILTVNERPDIRPPYENTVYQLNLATMQADTLVARSPQLINGAVYSPDGKKVLFYGSPEAFDGIGRNAGPFELANDYDIQMFIMDVAKRTVDPVTRDFNPSVAQVIDWNRADGRIYFIAEEGFMRPLYVYDPARGTFSRLPVEVENVGQVSIPAHSAARLAYTGQGFDYIGKAYLLDLKSGANRLLADPNSEKIAEIELGTMHPWNFTAADGKVIEGYYCLPPSFDPAKKYPMIVYYYGGTSPTQARLSTPYTPQLLASRDYVVYTLNPSGTTGYGQEFSARHVNTWGKYTADDIIEGVKKFIAEHKFVDADKVGCMGASYGGFMTQYLQTLTPMFAAAVSHAGISNVTSYWGEGYWGYSYNSVAAANSYPWNNPDLFTKQGSLFNADKITTPLLLLHGTADTNVPIGESIQLFNALRILGREVEFVSVEGENHFISDFAKRQLWQNTIMAWFAKHLQNDPRWWNHLYPERHL